MKRRICLFVNARARRGELWFDQAKSALIDRGFDLYKAQLFRDGRAMSRAILDSKAAGAPLVVVGGGDGTLRQAAAILSESDTVLGVLPFGTGNAFARDLGIPTSIDGACDIISSGEPQSIDLGVCNGKPFLSVATIGLSTLIARHLNSTAKRWLGPLAYLRPLVLAMQRIRPFRVTLTTDGRSFHFDCLQLVVGNGRYHAGPFQIADDAHLQTGELAIYGVATSERKHLILYLAALAQGKVEKLPQCESFRAQDAVVETNPRQRIVVDGEPFGTTPMRLGILPGALQVMAPRSLPGDDQSTSS